MINLKITIQYDGTNFSGWQIQPEGIRTVQGKIDRAIFNIYGEHFTIYGCGRTDAGVHAFGQVANIKLPFLKMPIERAHHALNNHIPRDIRVVKAELVDDSFNARASCLFREYIYVVDNADVFSPFSDKYTWFYRKNIIDENIINEYAKEFLGEHDFTSFCSSQDENEGKSRYIKKLKCIRKNDTLYFVVRGNAFLHNMVRIMVGTLVEAQRLSLNREDIKNIIEAKDRKKALLTAPARGLYFRRALF